MGEQNENGELYMIPESGGELYMIPESGGELYMIPESGGEPIKINGIASLSEIQCVDNLAEETSYARLSLMSEASFSFEVTGKVAKMLNRFARRTRRYLRRHEQQKNRRKENRQGGDAE